MNLYNNFITKRTNDFIRSNVILPKMRKKLLKKNITIISNNCTGGFVYHDLGLRFNSPTINLAFGSDEVFFLLLKICHTICPVSCLTKLMSPIGGVSSR